MKSKIRLLMLLIAVLLTSSIYSIQTHAWYTPGLTVWASGTWDKPSISVNFLGTVNSGYYSLQRSSLISPTYVTLIAKITTDYKYVDTNVKAGETYTYRLKHSTTSTKNLSKTFVWKRITSIAFTSTKTVEYQQLATQVKYELKVYPVDAGDQRLVWTSSNPSIASVSSNGTVLAVSKGITNISAKSLDGAKVDTFKVEVDNYERAHFPMSDMSITQPMNFDYSHLGYNAIDLASGKTDDVFAPFTGRVVVLPGSAAHTVFLQSTRPVRFASGEIAFMTCDFVHDTYIDNLYTGKVINKGTVFYQEGLADTTAKHLHMECGRGTLDEDDRILFLQSNGKKYYGFKKEYQLLIYKGLYVRTTTTLTNTSYANWNIYPWIIGN